MPRLFWTQKQDIGPGARSGHAMAYDEARKQTLLFGGSLANGSLASDTWAWDGEIWTQLEDTGPSGRAGHAMAFDGLRKQVVLFGGAAASPPASAAGETWVWDGESWTQVADTGPGSRSGTTMAYDAARKRVVLFGGTTDAGPWGADTWEWDGAEWTKMNDGGVSGRSAHALAYDADRKRVVLFGGLEPALAGPMGINYLGDTWEWNGETWAKVADTGPMPRFDSAMAYDVSRKRVVLFGGHRHTPQLGDTWEWDGSHWTQRQNMGPSPRMRHAMVCDTDRARVVLFGGNLWGGTPFAGDTWEWREWPADRPAKKRDE